MASWTKEQLDEYFATHVDSLVRNAMGKTDVADVIREHVLQSIKDAPQNNISKHLFDEGTDGNGTSEQKSKPLGSGIACYIRALANARNDRGRAAMVARSWGRQDVADAIARSEEKAMSATDPLSGGFTVPTEFATEVIELLRASAVVRGLGPTTIPMSTGTIKVPRITAGSTANYIGENTNAPKSQLATGQLTLTFKKLAALVPISNDLIRYAAPSADTIVRDDMIRSMSAREDLAFIRDDGLNGKPKGIKNWINAANKFAANSTVNLSNVTNDLGAAMQKLMDANINLVLQQGGTGAIDVRPGWLFSPRSWKYLTTVQTGLGTHAFRDEMLRGTLWGYPYRVTTQVEDTTVYFGAFAHAVIGESLGLVVDASQDAAYNDGSSVVAAFPLDQTVIRVLSEHDFALRHDKAFALITGVTWGA